MKASGAASSGSSSLHSSLHSSMTPGRVLPLLLLLQAHGHLGLIQRCAQVERQGSPLFQLVRRCSRSAMTVVAQANVTSLGRCADLAASRRGLAFNYSPRGAPRSEGVYSSSCLVLDCPEYAEMTSLHRDEAYDYYSLFTDPMPLSAAGWSCVPGVGLFRVRGLSPGPERANHSVAAERCREDSGELAHVLSEARTAGLSSLLSAKGRDSKNRTVGPVNRAYVDLDDIAQEGMFVTSAEEPLDCFPFRAWSPGEPRNRSAREDCVVLEKKKSWAVTDCAKRMPFICELYPGQGGADCDHEDDDAREACLELRRHQGGPQDRCEGWELLNVPPPAPTTTAAPIPDYGDDYDDDAEGGGAGGSTGQDDDDDVDDDGVRVVKRRSGRRASLRP